MFKSHRIMPKLAISTLALTAALATNAADSSRLFNIKAQSLDKALSQLSIQSDVIVVAPQQLVSGMKSSALNGAMSITDALEALLKGTGLKYSLTSDGAVLIEASEPEESVQGEAEKDIEEVIVTGSALVKDPGQVTKNVVIYDRQMIESSGATTMEEFMRAVPQNINAATEVGSGFAGDFGGAANIFGASGINLRGLGEQATLILIDGKRTAGGGALGNAVDISAIPLSQVERIDILLDGASSIYGADAVGGVVNIIMRRDYEGGLVNVEYQTPEDGGTEQYRFTMAKTFAWDSGNVSVNYSHLHRTRLNGEERPELRFSSRSALTDSLAAMPIVSPSNFTASERIMNPDTGEITLMPLMFLDADGNRVIGREWVDDLYGPGFGYWGDLLYSLDDPNYTPVYDAQLPASGAVTLNNASIGWQQGAAPTNSRSLMPERNDHSIRVDLDQYLNDDIKLSVSLNHTRSESNSSVSQQELAVNIPSYVFIDPDLGGVWIQPNPVNPFNAGFSMAAILPDVPNQIRDSERKNNSISIGLDGTFSNDWSWDVSARYSKSDNQAITLNQLDTFAMSFFESGDSGYNQYNPVTGELEVGIPFQGTYDLLSPNPYFGGTLEDFMQDFIYSPQPVNSENTQKNLELTFQGTLFSLPAGDANALLRVGRLEEEQLTTELSYLAHGNLISRTSFGGGGNMWELFSEGKEITNYVAAEMFVPVIGGDSDIPLVEELGISLSGRLDKLNYFEDTEPSLAFGTVWRLNDTFTVRYNYSDAFRAPDIGSVSLPAMLSPRGDNQPYFDGDVEVTEEYARTVIQGGNKNLEAEQSKSQTLSVEFTPEFLDGFKAKLSYHREEQTAQLGVQPEQSIQLADLALTPAEFAVKYPGVTVGDYSSFECNEDSARCYDGYIYRNLLADTEANYVFDRRVQNMGNTESDGVDLRLSYFMDTTVGEFDFVLDYGRTLGYQRKETDLCDNLPAGQECTLALPEDSNDPSINALRSQWWDLVGESPAGSPFFAIPEHRYSLRARWSYAGFEVSLNASKQSDVSKVTRVQENPYDRGNDVVVDQRRTYKTDAKVDLVAWYNFNELPSAPKWLANTRVKLAVPDVLQAKTTIEVSPELPADRFAPLVPQFANPYGRTFTLSVEKQF